MGSPRITVPYVDLGRQWAEERDTLLPEIDRALLTGQWIGGASVTELESELANYCGVAHAVTLNSGTDALILGLAALGVGSGHDVITPPNSFVASTAAVVRVGARPVFIDVGPDQNIDASLLDRVVTDRTRAIMPVHLTGRMADMESIGRWAQERQIAVIEDAAQAVGSAYLGRRSGSWGSIGAFSTHPLKNLNAVGDGGFATTDDPELAETMRLMRSHGLVTRDTVRLFGTVSRMDTVQAIVLRYRLARLDGVIARRRGIASRYEEALAGHGAFFVPERPAEFNTYHTFVVQVPRRDTVRRLMAEDGVETSIHYPNPIHLQQASVEAGLLASCPVAEDQASRILSLPVHQFLSDEDVETVVDVLLRSIERSEVA